MFPRAAAPFVLLVLAACSGAPPTDAREDDHGGVEPETARAVHGAVVGLDGAPLAGAKIAIGARAVVTDAAGRFAIADAPETYDAVLVRPLDGAVFAFQGLTRRDPTFWLYEHAAGHIATREASLRVALPHAAATERTLVFTERLVTEHDAPGGDGLVSKVGAGDAIDDAIDVSLAWSAAAAIDVSLYVLRYETDGTSNMATRYTGFGTARVHLENHHASAQSFDALAPVATRALTTKIEVPPALRLSESVLGVQFDPSARPTLLPVEAPSEREAIALVPDLPGATLVLAALGLPSGPGVNNSPYSTARATRAIDANAAWSIALSAGPGLLSPLAGASDISASTDFAWSGSGEGVHVVHFEPDLMTPVVAPDIYVQTREASVRIPDLTALGASFPSGAMYSWRVLSPNWMPAPGEGRAVDAPLGAEEERIAVSERRAFTIAR
jgi:hypothetical protein